MIFGIREFNETATNRTTRFNLSMTKKVTRTENVGRKVEQKICKQIIINSYPEKKTNIVQHSNPSLFRGPSLTPT